MNGSAQQHTWDGSGTQEEFMKRDECILVDEGDEIVGHSTTSWPTEVDTKEDVCNGSAPGAARAAIRKLEHELGISPETFSSPEDFKFLTRLHYCARDEKTWGPDAPWGEHEMDYILFAKVPNVVLNPNADEVQATAYVTRAEMKEMMEPNNGLLWSPWFRIIAETFLEEWWDDLEATLTTNKHVDAKTIHSILKE
ncbi:hypothetical protein M9434_002405 [Picochlorum sp. BPE23]|nr:hypothetical protein M9434_002405 [Picochlorum sp. BPE23]